MATKIDELNIYQLPSMLAVKLRDRLSRNGHTVRRIYLCDTEGARWPHYRAEEVDPSDGHMRRIHFYPPQNCWKLSRDDRRDNKV